MGDGAPRPNLRSRAGYERPGASPGLCGQGMAEEGAQVLKLEFTDVLILTLAAILIFRAFKHAWAARPGLKERGFRVLWGFAGFCVGWKDKDSLHEVASVAMSFSSRFASVVKTWVPRAPMVLGRLPASGAPVALRRFSVQAETEGARVPRTGVWRTPSRNSDRCSFPTLRSLRKPGNRRTATDSGKSMHSEHTGAAPWFYGTGARIGKNNTHGSQYLNEMHGQAASKAEDWSPRQLPYKTYEKDGSLDDSDEEVEVEEDGLEVGVEEVGFRYNGPEPTSFGDWAHKGRVTDF
eukprot:g18480.t1